MPQSGCELNWISATKHPNAGFGLRPSKSRRGFFHSFTFILKTSIPLAENSKARSIHTSLGNAQRKEGAEGGLGLPHPSALARTQ